MKSQRSTITLKPIGTVRNEVRKPPKSPYDWNSVVSRIEIDPVLTEALDNLDDFSHIIVLYWIDKLTAGPQPLKVHPGHDPQRPLVGLFASRSPRRPNSIGKATVKLLHREGNVLTVAGLDAIDDTPVIDLKPYMPGYDSADDASTPPWFKSYQ